MKMPHVSAASAAGDDLGSTDEVKVFKDEGGADDDEKRSPDNNLNEEKNSLIDLTESQVRIQTLKNERIPLHSRTLPCERRRLGADPPTRSLVSAAFCCSLPVVAAARARFRCFSPIIPLFGVETGI